MISIGDYITFNDTRGGYGYGYVLNIKESSVDVIVYDQFSYYSYTIINIPFTSVVKTEVNIPTTFDAVKINKYVTSLTFTDNNMGTVVNKLQELENSLPTTIKFKCKLENENGNCKIGAKVCECCVFGNKCNHCSCTDCNGCRYNGLQNKIKEICNYKVK